MGYYNIVVTGKGDGEKITKGDKKKMSKFKVTFKSDESPKIYRITVNALGICPAVEEAIRRMIVKPTGGVFYYPVKAEELTTKNSNK